MNKKPKVLLLDIETAPILAYCWGLFDQTVGLSQIHTDWYILSWSAKWLENTSGDVFGPHNKIMYADQRAAADIENDKELLGKIWKLLDESDIIITQNGRKFDEKKLNARFIQHGFQPPSKFKHLDTCVIAKRYFGFTSNKLEYLSDKLNVKFKKLKHEDFSGFDLWKQCLAGNKKAWKSMEEYNKHDTLALEELFNKLAPWDNSINFNTYTDEITNICMCGSKNIIKKGFRLTNVGKYQAYKCLNCGARSQGRVNLLSKEKISSLK